MRREVIPEAGWIPKAGKALGGGDWQEAGRGGLLSAVRAGQQINGRKSRRTFSDLFLSCMKCNAACPRKRSRAKRMKGTSPFSARTFDARSFVSPGTARRKRSRADKRNAYLFRYALSILVNGRAKCARLPPGRCNRLLTVCTSNIDEARGRICYNRNEPETVAMSEQ